MPIDNQIDLTIGKFKEYLNNKLNTEKTLNDLIEKHIKYQHEPTYSCMYCKEIISISKLIGQYNCSFKPFSIKQLECLNYKLPNRNDIIPLIAILSAESTTVMVEHNQYLFIININPVHRSFTIEEKYTTIPINCYDPILSKSLKYNNCYKYEKLLTADFDNFKITSDYLLEKIDQDNLKSLPIEMRDYYNNCYSQMPLENKKNEIRHIFPFLQDIAVTQFSKSDRNSRYFLYGKVFINDYLNQLIFEIFNNDEFQLLKTIFVRLNDKDIKKICSANSDGEQFDLLYKILQKNLGEKGLCYDEYIALITEQINKNDKNPYFDQDFYKSLRENPKGKI